MKIIDFIFSPIPMYIILALMFSLVLYKTIDVIVETNNEIKLMKQDVKEIKEIISKEQIITVNGINYKISRQEIKK